MTERPGRVRTPLASRVARWFDARVGGASYARKLLDKVFPDHWSFLISEVALWCFVILLATGTWLTFFFEPSDAVTTYDGRFVPLQGVTMSKAYESSLNLSFDVRAGLVMRQMHHWAALVFAAATVAHLARTFFTGAFRKPRELNWVLGVLMLLLILVEGFVGYSLLDDQLSGTGLRIAYNIALSIPVGGTWIASLFFGGEFPGRGTIARLYGIHILLLPAVLAVLIGTHLALVFRQKHTQFSGPGRREDNVVGERIWPTYVMKVGALFFITAGLLAMLGGLAQINPIWYYGPYRSADVSAASQPDWYLGWTDGALRLMPSLEIRAFGYEIPNPFYPAVLLPGLTFLALALWPWLEARFTRDRERHNLLDRPRDRPVRTGLGVATFAFYIVLFFGGASDVLAVTFDLSVNAVFLGLQILLLVVPPIAGYVAYRLCKELTATETRPARPPPVTTVPDAG